MYGGLTLFGTVLLAGLPISIRLVRLLRAAGSRASGWARGAAILSIVLVLIVALPFLALLFLEGYWMLALAALVVLYFGFFGVGSLRRRRP